MMQAYELQLKKKYQTSRKGIALGAAENQTGNLEDKVSLMVRKYFRKYERGQHKGISTRVMAETEKETKKSDKQCAESEGIGHYRSEFLTIKRRNLLKCY